MVLPSPEHDPLFRKDGRPFAEKMREYIRENFSEFLGRDVALLEGDDWMDRLQERYSLRGGNLIRIQVAAA